MHIIPDKTMRYGNTVTESVYGIYIALITAFFLAILSPKHLPPLRSPKVQSTMNGLSISTHPTSMRTNTS